MKNNRGQNIFKIDQLVLNINFNGTFETNFKSRSLTKYKRKSKFDIGSIYILLIYSKMT